MIGETLAFPSLHGSDGAALSEWPKAREKYGEKYGDRSICPHKKRLNHNVCADGLLAAEFRAVEAAASQRQP